MIKISRTPRPKKLSDKEVKKLTEQYKQEGKNVWNKPFIKDELLKMTHNKCCYCETALGEGGAYMEVEHFHPKSIYKDEVVAWDNLFASCKRCNMKKGDLDTYKTKIINPCEDNPREYIYMQNYVYKSINNNEIGRNTIKSLLLNDMDQLIVPRFRIGNEVENKIQEIYDFFLSIVKDNSNINVISKNAIWQRIKDLLRLAQPTEKYSATIATAIVGDDTYDELKNELIRIGIWDEELVILDQCMRKISMCKCS